MAEKPEDLNLPAAVVTRIIKDALPEGCNVAREAKLALAKAASVFVLYLTSHANQIAIGNGKKTITNKDVLEAIQDTEFGRFHDPLSEASEQFKQLQKSKKEFSGKRKSSKGEDKEERSDEEIEAT